MFANLLFKSRSPTSSFSTLVKSSATLVPASSSHVRRLPLRAYPNHEAGNGPKPHQHHEYDPCSERDPCELADVKKQAMDRIRFQERENWECNPMRVHKSYIHYHKQSKFNDVSRVLDLL